jgi:hypothetical protein
MTQNLQLSALSIQLSARKRIQKTVDTIQKTEDRMKIKDNKTNHESTKIGKHEKGPRVLCKPLFFRVFVPAKLTAGKFRVSVIRGCFTLCLAFFSTLGISVHFSLRPGGAF